MKQQKGITLVALVITIIVLLILAGVALATLTGDNNIVGQANTAVNKYNAAVGNDETVVQEVNNLLNKYFTQLTGTSAY